MSLSSLLLLLLVPQTGSAPAQGDRLANLTHIEGIWVGEPDCRGTWGIIQSCLDTLFLCVYTAVHPNIRPEQGVWRAYVRRFWLTFVASALPEFVLVLALKQWYCARRLQKKVNNQRANVTSCKRCSTYNSASSESGVQPPSIPSISLTEAEGSESLAALNCHQSQDKEHKSDPTTGNETGSSCPKGSDLRDGNEIDRASTIESLDVSTIVAEDERVICDPGSMQTAEAAAHEWHCSSETTCCSLASPEARRRDDVDLERACSSEPKWTLAQAFFAVAGGFAVRTKAFRTAPYLTLTPTGVVELARLGLLPSVSALEIEDKSKADPITKIVVCVQAAWFISQCVARVAQNLPLTLLEIHTLAHVIVAFIMFLFWFEKPYNALSPIVLGDPELEDAAALFALCRPEVSLSSDSRMSDLKCGSLEDLKLINVTRAPAIRVQSDTHLERLESWMPNANQGVQLLDTEHTSATRQDQWSAVHHDTRPSTGLDSSFAPPYVRPISYAHLRFARRAVHRLRSHGLHFTWRTCENGQMVTECLYGVDRLDDFRIQGDFSETKIHFKDHKVVGNLWRPSQISLLYPLAALYAAFHLSAWNSHFPTEGERSMWKISVLSVISLPFLIGFDCAVFGTQTAATKLMRSSRLQARCANLSRRCATLETFVQPLQVLVLRQLWYMIVWGALIAFNFAATVGARGFLVIEAFISLRAPAENTYKTVGWTNFLPHA